MAGGYLGIALNSEARVRQVNWLTMTVHWSRPNMGSTLNVDQIAELLRFYEDALSSVRLALTDPELSPSYLMLTDVSVTGETTRRYGDAAKESKNL